MVHFLSATVVCFAAALDRPEMAERRRNGLYIWVTWLTRLLVGENSCEWAAWFRARHESWSWERVSSGFDLVG